MLRRCRCICRSRGGWHVTCRGTMSKDRQTVGSRGLISHRLIVLHYLIRLSFPLWDHRSWECLWSCSDRSRSPSSCSCSPSSCSSCSRRGGRSSCRGGRISGSLLISNPLAVGWRTRLRSSLATTRRQHLKAELRCCDRIAGRRLPRASLTWHQVIVATTGSGLFRVPHGSGTCGQTLGRPTTAIRSQHADA